MSWSSVGRCEVPNLDPFPDVTADEFGAIAAAESTTPLRGRPFPLAPVLVRILAIGFVPIGRLSGFVRGDVDEASANVVVDDEEEDEDEPCADGTPREGTTRLSRKTRWEVS